MKPVERKMPVSLIYIFLWLIFFITPVITNNYSVTGGSRRILYDWLSLIPFMLVFLLNNFVLLRQFLFRGKAWIYAAGLLATALIISLTFQQLNPLIHKNDPDIIEARLLQDPQYGREEMRPGINGEIPSGASAAPEIFRSDDKDYLNKGRANVLQGNSIIVLINTLVISLLVAGFNTAIAVTNRWSEEEQARKEIEKEHVESKLAFLQNQVNPHFLMNTLNNIHSLIDVDQQLARDAVIKLSSMMRYLLYESGRGTTTLQREIEFLKSYLELMQLRVDKSVNVELHVPDNFRNVTIPPLLFIPFIENAFKHGVSYREPSSMIFKLSQFSDRLEFHSENTIPAFLAEKPSDYQGGFGLENIKKRLEMLYGNRHSISIENADNRFIVNLTIPV
jgi:hypothetical protein